MFKSLVLIAALTTSAIAGKKPTSHAQAHANQAHKDAAAHAAKGDHAAAAAAEKRAQSRQQAADRAQRNAAKRKH